MQKLKQTRNQVAVVKVNNDFFQSRYSVIRLSAVMGEYNRIVFDMHAVRMIDSYGCGVLLGCLKQLTHSGGDLKLCRVRKSILTMFELIRIHRIVEIHETLEEAVGSF